MQINSSYSVITTSVQEILFSAPLENFLEESVLSSLVIIDFCRKKYQALALSMVR